MSGSRSAHEVVFQVVEGLGYDMIELEWLPGGLMRVTIDFPYVAPESRDAVVHEALISVEDCERVTRQLQYVLEVEGVGYERLEVASPGIDRPLRHTLDFQRFVGALVDVTLKEAMEFVQDGASAGLRKRFRGILESCEAEDHTEQEGTESAKAPQQWRILWSDAPKAKPGARVSAKRKEVVYQVLTFSLDELEQARLAPVVDFKGRRAQPAESM